MPASSICGTGCAWTKSGQQDGTCKFYKAWLDKKKMKVDLASPLSLESHVDEHHSKPFNFVDYDHQKAALDKVMLKKLTKSDAKLYRLLYIKHLPVEKVMKIMSFKRTVKNKTDLRITKARNRFYKMAAAILGEMGLS